MLTSRFLMNLREAGEPLPSMPSTLGLGNSGQIPSLNLQASAGFLGSIGAQLDYRPCNYDDEAEPALDTTSGMMATEDSAAIHGEFIEGSSRTQGHAETEVSDHAIVCQ
jgi:hypothetical protein